MIEKEIKHAPEVYKIGTSKFKNQNLEKALESDVANYIVWEARKKSKQKIDINNIFGNFQFEEAFKNINDENIDDNFVGVFHSNHMNKFIDMPLWSPRWKENIRL